MRIVLFTDSLGAGGAQRQLAGLAVMLQEHGHDVVVSTYHPMDFYKSYLDENRVPNEIIPNACSHIERIWSVFKYLKDKSPDWVIAYQETPSLVACLSKFLGCNFKLIVSERNTTQHVGMKERIRFFLYKWANHIVPNSFTQEKFLVSHYLWMKKKLKVISNFVDLDTFSPNYHKINVTIKVLVVATIRESKNTRGLIEAVSILKEKGVDCHFEWYGISSEFEEYYNECKDSIRMHDLSNYIELKEKTKDISKKYREADVFCLPSFYEGTPNVICEALSSGLPIIASNVCDNSHYVIDGKNGVLFNPNNPSDMADKFIVLFDMINNDYSTIQKTSRTIAENKLCKSFFLEQYLSLIEK